VGGRDVRIGVLGTGMVGTTISTRLVELGHEVKMGARSAGNEKAAAWAKANGALASAGSFEEAARFGELLFNCTAGVASLEALRRAGAASMRGKVLVDVSNPLDFSRGMPPSLTVSNTDSLGEQIQRAFPDVKVVKTLNTVNCRVMVNPALVPGIHDAFVSGDDVGAKATVTRILKEWFGWRAVIDLGDITTARGTEQFLPLWVRLLTVMGTPVFNVHIVRQEGSA
jgi:predicted dinucleotide-binding enzyme